MDTSQPYCLQAFIGGQAVSITTHADRRTMCRQAARLFSVHGRQVDLYACNRGVGFFGPTQFRKWRLETQHWLGVFAA